MNNTPVSLLYNFSKVTYDGICNRVLGCYDLLNLSFYLFVDLLIPGINPHLAYWRNIIQLNPKCLNAVLYEVTTHLFLTFVDPDLLYFFKHSFNFMMSYFFIIAL